MSQEHFLTLPILILLLGGTIAELTLKFEKLNRNIIESIVKIIKSRAETTCKLAIQNSQEYTFLASELIKNILVPIVINVKEHRFQGMDTRQPVDLSLILDNNPNPTEILNNTLWNTNTRFLLLMDNRTNLDAIFQKFWARRVIHAYALIENNNAITVHGFEVYKSAECASVDIKIIDEWVNGQFTKNGLTEINSDTRIRNYNGCPVNISIVNVKPNVMFYGDKRNCLCSKNIDGIEGKVLIELTKKLKMNATYVMPSDGILWGWIHPSPAGVVGDVYTGRSEFGFGLLAPTLERYENLELSIPYNGDECITFGVPRGAGIKRPDWLDLLISEFTHETWMWVLITFISICITYFFLNKISNKYFPNVLFIPIHFFALSLNVPLKPPSNLKKIFITWVWCSFILTNAYQASMGSKLTVKKLDPDVDTFHDLLYSTLKITGYYNMLRLMQYEHNEGEMQDMVDKFVVTKFDIDEGVHQIVENREIAYLRHTTTFIYYSLINPKARGEIHIIGDCVYRYYPSFVMKKYSPMMKKVNEIVSSLKEMGIIQYWRSMYIYDYPPMPEGFLKLSLGHMKGLFYIFPLGLALSIIVLLLEISYYALVHYCGKNSMKLRGRKFKLRKKIRLNVKCQK